MFDQAFNSRVDTILSGLRSVKVVDMTILGICLGGLKAWLHEAEVRDEYVRQFVDLVLDHVGATPAMSGCQLAAELRTLLEETPGLERSTGTHATWSDFVPGRGITPEPGPGRWDFKEFDNRLSGLNLASLGRLRNAIGLTSERPLQRGAGIGRRRRFQACTTMQVTDQHDVDINSEQVNRLIRYLGWGDSDSDPRGGRHAILG